MGYTTFSDKTKCCWSISRFRFRTISILEAWHEEFICTVSTFMISSAGTWQPLYSSFHALVDPLWKSQAEDADVGRQRCSWTRPLTSARREEALRFGWHCIWFNWEKVPNEQNATPWCCNYHYFFDSWWININISLIMTNTSTVLFSTPSQSSLPLRGTPVEVSSSLGFVVALIDGWWFGVKPYDSCWGFASTSWSLFVAVAERSSSSWKPSVLDGSSDCLG